MFQFWQTFMWAYHFLKRLNNAYCFTNYSDKNRQYWVWNNQYAVSRFWTVAVLTGRRWIRGLRMPSFRTLRSLRKYLLLCYTLLPVFATSLAAEAENGPRRSIQQRVSKGLHTSGYCITWYISTTSAALSLCFSFSLIGLEWTKRSTLTNLRLERSQFCTIFHLHVQTSAVHPIHLAQPY